MTQYIERQHNIIVVTICSDTTDGLRARNDKLILGCEKGENYKNKGKSKVTCSRSVVCFFRLRSVPYGCGWYIKVRCGIHNHRLIDDLDDHTRPSKTIRKIVCK